MKPILFSTPMVQANEAGIKTETRRVITDLRKLYGLLDSMEDIIELAKPKYLAGDVLWVRETWMPETEDGIPTGAYIYKAIDHPEPDGDRPLKWRPSIHMPREAARTFLRVRDVWAEQVQEITQEGALHEGIQLYDGWETPEYKRACAAAYAAGTKPPLGMSPRERYKHLWDKLNKERGYGWDKNPWVWVYKYTKISKEEAEAA